jgi:hypothetical protein
MKAAWFSEDNSHWAYSRDLPRRSHAVVVGTGPNGLSALITLAMTEVSVTVFEANATIGGGARSMELTLPGFIHDLCTVVHGNWLCIAWTAHESPFTCSGETCFRAKVLLTIARLWIPSNEGASDNAGFLQFPQSRWTEPQVL